MKRKTYLALSVSCFLTAFLLLMAWQRLGEESLAARIAPQLLRFHVLANSDRPEDQALKLEVRTLLLNKIYEELGDSATLEETKTFISVHSSQLEETAETYMKTRGYDYPAHIELTNCYFPTKAYGDMIFPCGYYDAARVLIGSGRGHNWWCVLYPQLCFVDSTYAVVPEESKEKLEASLGETDYQSLLDARPQNRTLAARRDNAGNDAGYADSGLGYSGSGLGYSGSGLGYSGSGLGYSGSGLGHSDSGLSYSDSGSTKKTIVRIRSKLWEWLTAD